MEQNTTATTPSNHRNHHFALLLIGIAALVAAGIYGYGSYKVSHGSTCPPGQFCGGSVSASSVPPGGSYTATCNYGYVGNGITVVPGSGRCAYKDFSGTTAEFDCTAGLTPGTFSTTCNLSSKAEPYPSRTDALSPVTITPVVTPTPPPPPPTTNDPLIPANAIAVNNLQNLGSWHAVHDTGTPGNAFGVSTMVINPSLSGLARELLAAYIDNGGVRSSIDFGRDPNATHFIYDVWVNLGSSGSNIQNLELDMNQVTADGRTIIYGTQCSGVSKTWEYTVNRGGHPKWEASNIPCDPATWSPNTWHHVQIASHRDNNGTVTYDWVNLDGALNYFQGATGNSAFSLGWGRDILLANFQVDGKGKNGMITAYADRFTVWRW